MSYRMFLSPTKELFFNEITFNVLSFPPIYFEGTLHQLTNLKFKHFSSGEDVYIMIKCPNQFSPEIVLYRHCIEVDCDGAYQYYKNISIDDWATNRNLYSDYKSVDINQILPILRAI